MLNQREEILAYLKQHNGASGTMLLKKFQSLDPVFELVAQGLVIPHHWHWELINQKLYQYISQCVDQSACFRIVQNS